jgi:hypothetical protein
MQALLALGLAVLLLHGFRAKFPFGGKGAAVDNAK